MTCPAEARLAAAASGEDHAAFEHARECLHCRSIVDAQREVIAAARTIASPRLRAERRAGLAAEVMAQSDALAPSWRGGRVMVATSVLAAAAIALLVITSGTQLATIPDAPDVASAEEPAIEVTARAHTQPVAMSRRAAVIASGADFARAQRGDRDVVVLRDGEVSIDATDREPVTVVAGDTRVTIASSRAKVVARRGVIVTTHVFAGTAQVKTKRGSLVIDAGDVWMRDPEVARPPEASPVADSLAAFRRGWEALRAHRHADAIAAFDRATDPVVAEDAAFWAAIAAERAGERAVAALRLHAFLERFPDSPRAAAAQSALERVTP